MGTALERSESETDALRHAESYGVPGEVVNGMDVLEVEAAAHRAVANVRAGSGPYFLENRTYRFRAHSMFDPELYRTKAEVDQWKEKGPIVTFRSQLEKAGLLSAEEVGAIEEEIWSEIDDAVAFAEAGTWESTDDLSLHVYG